MKLLRQFLSLGVIVPALPYNIQNGQVEDAVPVMANFNAIVNAVNANIPPLIPALGATPIYVPLASVGGSANAITLAPSPVNTGYAAGQRYSFPPTAANTGAVTIQVSGLASPQALVDGSGAALTGGELQTGGIVDIQYNGTNFILLNDAQGTGLLTFTPTIAFAGASVGVTYSTQSGQYYKVGRLVFYYIYIVLTNKGSSVGIASIRGLPYAVNTAFGGAGVMPAAVCMCSNMAFGANSYVMAAPQPNNTFIDLVISGNSAAVAFVNDGGFSNSSSVAVSGVYFT